MSSKMYIKLLKPQIQTSLITLMSSVVNKSDFWLTAYVAYVSSA